MGDINRTDNPLEETAEDRVERELRNSFGMLYSIDRRLEEIANSVEANTANIEILEEAISTIATIPTRPIKLRYKHRENKLWINERIFMKFEGREADVLGHMFFKTNGSIKKTKFQCSEVAEKLSDPISQTRITNKAISQTAKRVQAKLNKRLNTRNLLVVTTKEFYFSLK